MVLDLTKDILGVTQFRATMGDSLERIESTKRPLVLTKGGRPSVVVLDVETYQDMLDSLEELNKRALLEGVARAEADIKAGQVVAHEEVAEELKRRREKLKNAQKAKK